MKYLLCLSGLLVSAAFAQAGGFGGPPPFTNGSPLISGVDGSYQASARGSNLSGVFRFTYSGGRQTSDPQIGGVPGLMTDPYNDYVFFVEGIVYRGLVQANINESNLAGVFDNGAANIPNYEGGTGSGILTFLSGFFEGTIDLDAPDAYFKGDGEVATWVGDSATDTFTPRSRVDYKFRGVRNSQSTGS